MLKFFQYAGRFPEGATEIPPAVIEYVAQQLELPQEVINKYKGKGRSRKEHRREIRELMGFHPATLTDQEQMRLLLMQEILPQEHRSAYLEQLVYQRWRQAHIEPPSLKQVERLITSAIYGHEQVFFNQTAARLSENIRAKLRELIYQKIELMGYSI